MDNKRIKELTASINKSVTAINKVLVHIKARYDYLKDKELFETNTLKLYELSNYLYMESDSFSDDLNGLDLFQIFCQYELDNLYSEYEIEFKTTLKLEYVRRSSSFYYSDTINDIVDNNDVTQYHRFLINLFEFMGMSDYFIDMIDDEGYLFSAANIDNMTDDDMVFYEDILNQEVAYLNKHTIDEILSNIDELFKPELWLSDYIGRFKANQVGRFIEWYNMLFGDEYGFIEPNKA